MQERGVACSWSIDRYGAALSANQVLNRLLGGVSVGFRNLEQCKASPWFRATAPPSHGASDRQNTLISFTLIFSTILRIVGNAAIGSTFTHYPFQFYVALDERSRLIRPTFLCYLSHRAWSTPAFSNHAQPPHLKLYSSTSKGTPRNIRKSPQRRWPRRPS